MYVEILRGVCVFPSAVTPLKNKHQNGSFTLIIIKRLCF